MTDSSSFSSLLALVDSHLSKTNIQGSRSEDANVSTYIPIPSLQGAQGGALSDTWISFSPGQRLPIPSFNLTGSPIQTVLAEQVANMLKAKELKKQQDEEKLRLVEEMRKVKIEEDNDVIDLMQALHSNDEMARMSIQQSKEEVTSISSSLESLFEPKFIDCDNYPDIPHSPEPLLPCITDMSYILRQKIPKGKCSAFGKVLTSRLKPVAAPYIREKIDSKIVRFDFKTQSPCDIIKEKLRRPTQNCSYQPDILSMLI